MDHTPQVWTWLDNKFLCMSAGFQLILLFDKMEVVINELSANRSLKLLFVVEQPKRGSENCRAIMCLPIHVCKVPLHLHMYKQNKTKLILNLTHVNKGIFIHGYMNQLKRKLQFSRALWLISVYVHIFLRHIIGWSIKYFWV